MKILRLNAKNINSLRGEFSIDFEEFLRDNSLFAITGPTGSGKSTILDIISCALYGKTPRLKNPNNLMSKHTGECFCEVEFEVKGKFYRSSWSLKRAYKRADGKFQNPKMEISDIESNKILESRVKEVPKYVEKLSGLDFEKFTKSMMLAQGAFDAFLKAKESDRSSLLEKITGTFIYKEISQKVYQNYSDKKREIELEESKLKDIRVLNKEELREKEDILNELSHQKEEFEKKRREIEKKYNWLTNIEKLKKESREYEEDFIKLKRELEKKKEDFNKLEEAKKALRVEPIYQIKNSLKKNIELNRKKLEELKYELKELEKNLKNKNSKYRDIDEKYQKEKEKVENEKRKIEFKLKEIEISYQKIKNILSKEKNCREEIKKIEELLEKREEYREIEENILKEENSKIDFKYQLENLKEKKEEKNRLIEELESHLKSLKEKEERELLIIKYEKDRERLKEGEECFLCGSKYHPFINHSLKIDIEKSKNDIKREEEKIKEENRELIKIEKEISSLESKINNSKKEIEKSKKRKRDIEKLFKRYSFNSEEKLKREKERLEKELKEIEIIQIKKEELLKEKEKIFRLFEGEEKKLNKIERERRELSDEVIFLTSNKKSINRQIEELNRKQKSDILEFQKREEEFKRELEKENFTEELFLNAKLPQKEFEKLERVCKRVEESYKKIETLKNSTKKRLEEERSLNLTDKNLIEIEESRREIEDKIDKIQKERGSLEKELKIDEENREKYKKKIEELEKRREEFKIVSKLNEMIGSANGDKFSKFAQGVTLDQLIYLANRYLTLLNSRYKLQRSLLKDKILDIEIIDTFQGDVIRPVNTLSGGESFLVSLSLALGLSSLASQKISIDSLFLDEGFGSLDNENLEMAINALDTLKNRGKIVGVISHVEALKERIRSQIRVIPNGDGTSKIRIS